MSDPIPPEKHDRIPRGAIVTVVIGVILSLGVLALEWRGGGSSAELEWSTKEAVATPPAERVGTDGSMELVRTSVSALPPNAGGELIFRVAGIVRVDSGGRNVPTRVQCDITGTAPGTTVARTMKKRAAWPRPSDELQRQQVPEAAVVKFRSVGADVLGLPIRDSIRKYTNSASPTTVKWRYFDDELQDFQNWVWNMEEGTGPGPASLGYAAVFKTTEKPEADIACRVNIGGAEATQLVEVEQQEWPLEDLDPSSLPADPELDVE